MALNLAKSRYSLARATLGTALALGSACGGEATPPPAAPPAATAPSPAPVATQSAAPPAGPAPQTQGEAHRFVVRAASCWFGGSWADALGEQDQAKQAGIESRCRDVSQRVWNSDDKAHVEQLRALEMNAVADVIAKVDSLSKTDSVDAPRRDALVSLTTALADALKETMLARRAGDRVKRDLDREPDKLTTDEIDAVIPLRTHAKVEVLYKLDAGDLTKEARTLALLCALDRLETARGLPKHLKLYAVADEFKLLFGVNVPDVPTDGSKKLVPGTWLKFLAETAKAAGHPVSDKAKTPRERDALAWAGMLEGFSDKLKAEADGVSPDTDLSKVATVAIHRLEAEYHAQQAADATAKKSGPSTPKK
jgi:hypothetical protein